MKTMKKIKFVFFSLALLSIMGCSTNDDDNSITITKADIFGTVNLYDEDVLPIDSDGMKIIMNGTSPEISTLTTINGGFTLKDAPFGTYTLRYEKEGYGTYMLFNLNHTNSGGTTTIDESPSLDPLATTSISFLSDTISGTDVFLYLATEPLANIGNPRYYRYFYHNASDISNTNYTTYSEVRVTESTFHDHVLSQSDLIGMGFTSGETVYVKAYGDSYWSNDYDNTDLGRRVFPNMNMTTIDAVSFLVP